jgi:hypothetical protein
MNKRDELLALLQKDPFGLLKDERPKKTLSEEENTLVSSFEEIQNFVEEHGREPQSNMANINEFKLYSRLKAIRSDANKVKVLKKYDFGGLVQGEGIKEITIEDIISDDAFGLLESDAETDILSLKHVKPVERIKPDYLSRRKVCRDFAHYKEMFATLHEELASKKRRLVKYKSLDLKVDGFYALGGVLLYLKSVEGQLDTYKYSSGERDRFDGRTVCIFDNGTQSDMLFRSLDKAMQLDGYSISDLMESEDGNSQINDSDIFNGYIYILKSRNPHVQQLQDLYKIGHTTGSISERIKNAKQEATYLFNDVDVIATFRCLNIESYNLEQTIHDFFACSKLDIELLDIRGSVYNPKEWFKVKLNVIEDAIKLIVRNKINDFVYDDKIQQIVKKEK